MIAANPRPPVALMSESVPTDDRSPCGGACILDLALCMIIAVAFIGLLSSLT
ncbi:hypothetical protein MKK70_14040 [Methylobacterium sp. E-041]|uniref:hypothetical protein n=1 Tax=Methylobacterium sp. E-041 TaxID=2836573 RepID=UPI001FBAB15F|nr:hypothetical protein [Methylobacterium sp. E-041]MCJ2106479.1 hypothetical protein [Methylobacterium sp. E-041]